VDVLGRHRPERFVQPAVQILVRPVVVAAVHACDAEVGVVDNAREVIRRGAVLAQERDPVEAIRPDLLRRLAVPVESLALPYRPFVPRDSEPVEVAENRLLAPLDVPRRIGVVDSEQHPVARAPVDDRAERVANVERARRARSEAHANHGIQSNVVVAAE